MRNEALTGYLLHQRLYQEKRALYYLFSQQHGVIHGIGKKGAPLFEPLQLFATGKRDLKTFSQINILLIRDSCNNIEPSNYQQISGQQQYAALYLNEILWKLLPTEDPMPVLWQHYQDSLLRLKQPLTADGLRLCLRQFEQYLFQQLGFAILLTHDSSNTIIDPTGYYRFLPDVGLVPLVQSGSTDSADSINSIDDISATDSTQAVFRGNEILVMAEAGITVATLNAWSRLHRHLLDHLLDYQPLQSRLLWQQQQRYQ